jgi:hypothetical protein
MLGGPRASPGRLRAWADVLDRNLVGKERIKGNPYYWLSYRIKSTKPMLIADAVKIYIAGIRIQESDATSDADREAKRKSGEYLHSPYEWQIAFGEHLPVVQHYLYGYGFEFRFKGIFDGPFVPVMLPLEYVPVLAEELAAVIVERDDGRQRARKGEQIERFLKDKVTMNTAAGSVPWNFSASYAIEQIATRVLFRHYYRGRFGKPDERLYSAVNEAGFAISREFERMLGDERPGAFGRAKKRLSDEVEMARKTRDE